MSGLCESCYQRLPWLKKTCRYCAFPLSEAMPEVCGKCLNQTHDLDVVQALFRYEQPIRKMILDLKFHQKLYHAQLLGHLLANQLKTHQKVDAIVPVPLAPGRIKSRGYNQALEIAKILSRALSLSLVRQGIRKRRDTLSQADLGGARRKTNIRRSDFEISPRLRHKKILLIDDVMTTGTTLSKIASALKKNHVDYVEAWVVGRSL